MTRLAIAALTPTGIRLAKKIQTSCETELPIFVPESKMETGLTVIPTGNFKQGLQQLFQQYDGLICIMAIGIVVRSIAEVVNDKRRDPAVIVLDEKGQHVISLLSGHIGGGNQLAREIAEKIGGLAVITTATDVQEVTSLDLLAKEINGWYADFKETTKKINGLLADHQKVGLLQREKWVQDLRGLTLLEEGDPLEPFEAVLLISDRNEPLTGEKIIQVVPRNYILGIGARKGVTFEAIQEEYLNFCQQKGIHPQAVKKIVSIDLKKEEAGICQLATWLAVPFETYSAKELAPAAAKYPQSEFVKQTTGIGNVSLAAADLASGGQVISERYAQHGVTFALGKDGK